MGADPHSAAASILGYAFQVKSGLLELLGEMTSRPDLLLTLEMHDDIAWEDSSGVVALKQYKLHQKREGHLGDSSDDLWRTLKVWLDRPSPADPLGPDLWIVTTAVASDGSVAAMLRCGEGRRVAEAVAALEVAAEASKNKATEAARKKFLALAEGDRAALVGRIFVADGSGDLAALETDVANVLRVGAPYDHFAAYLEQVWGWWGREALRLLQGKRPAIGVQELLRALDRIRDQFTSENLPPTVSRDEIDIDQVMVDDAERLYVHQLRRINLQSRQLAKAVMDYQRAYLQSTRWLESNLVDYAELEEFAADLHDEWERAFDYRCVRLSGAASEEDKRAVGRELLYELENSSLTIRAFRDPFFARGQRHALAEDEKLGWHPDFQQHLEQFLLGGPAA